MKRESRFAGLQALRAAAALAVVMYHADDLWPTRFASQASVHWANAAAGVDIFFVISGFVMMLSAWRLQGAPRPGSMFLRSRLRRIVPLYWLCSLAKMAALALAGDAGRLGVFYCAASLLFLPVHDSAGAFKPVLPVGWTLSFEMLFYFLFAVALGARRAPALYIPPILLALAVMPGGGVWAELCNPVVLEFAYGMALALLWRRGWLNTAWAGGPLLLAGAAGLIVMPKLFLGVRFLSWGLPAGAVVAGMVALEPVIAGLVPRLLLALGDASYAIYLTHGFVLSALAVAWRSAWIGEWAIGRAICAVLASACFGWLVHRFIERRLLGMAERAQSSPPLVLVLVGGGFAPLSGGIGVLLRNLVDAWACMPSAPHVRVLDTRGTGSKLWSVLHFARAALLVTGLCATGRVHLVHAHMTTRGSALRKSLLCSLAMILRVPVVIHMHGADFMAFFRRLPRILRAPLGAVLRRAAHVVVLGAAWRGFLIDDVGVAPMRVSILANGVPLPARIPSAQRQGRPRILFLGRLCERKGLPELIAALGMVSLRGGDWEAVIAGDGDLAPYRAMIGWHRLGGRVELPGWVGRDKAAALLGSADMLVLPSYHEAMPIAVLEALAAGVAVITTPVGAMPELLQDGKDALLVTPGDVAGLAAAIVSLLDDPQLRARLAAAGHRVFREKLEISGIAQSLAGLYDTAMARPGLREREAAE